MTKFTKSLLTAAVVGALALPSIASAATLSYSTSTQITFAKDLIVNDGITVRAADGLELKATAVDVTNIATIVGGDRVAVKITLTNGAKFDPNALALPLVQSFLMGDQIGGANAAIGAAVVAASVNYSAGGTELNFQFQAPGAGVIGVAGDYVLGITSLDLQNLVDGLYLGDSVSAQITLQNQAGQQVLAGKAVIARSEWGLDISRTLGNAFTTIDVAGGGAGGSAWLRKTRFSATGTVGGSSGPGNSMFVPGTIDLAITEADETNTANSSFVNNFDANALNPDYNVVNTGEWTIKVNGTDLAAFAPSNIFLANTGTCSTATPANTVTGTVTGGTATFKLAASHPFVAPLAAATPGSASIDVCLRATNKEMVPQALSASVDMNYMLSTQRVNPPTTNLSLRPLVLNGTTILFQNVNPGGNSTAQSFLRLTNNNSYECPIFIDAKDDAGLHTTAISYVLPAHTSKQINSDVLENGGAGFTGSWGDGSGKWYVRVTAECANFAGSALNRHQDGVVTDLTPAKGETWLTPSTKLNP